MTIAIICMTAIATLVSTSACGNKTDRSQDKKIELSVLWWGGPERQEITEKALNLYTMRNPKITFKKQSQSNKGYFDKLVTMAASGDMPDIYQIDENNLSESVFRNIALDLSAYFRPQGIIKEDEFNRDLLERRKIGGKPFAVPNATNTQALIYDKTALKNLGMPEPQIGWTYEQLIDWGTTITTKSGKTIYGTMDPSGDYKAFWVWLKSKGKEFYRGSQLGFTSEDLRQWFDLWAGARRRNATPPAGIIGAANTNDISKQLIINKQGITTFAWSNMLEEYQKNTDHELELTTYPGNPKGQWIHTSQYWSIYKGSKYPEESAKVIDFLVNDVEAGKILGTERGLPANLTIRAMIALSTSPTIRKISEFEEKVSTLLGPIPQLIPNGHNRIQTLLLNVAESIQWDNITTKQAADQFMLQSQAALKS